MCRALSANYTICQHTTTTSFPCPPSTPQPSLFARLLRPATPTHRTSSEQTFLNAFCPSCTLLWNAHAIPKADAREMISEFRILNSCHGTLIPVVLGDGSLGLVQDSAEEEGELGVELSDPMDGEVSSLSLNLNMGDEEKYLSKLNSAKQFERSVSPTPSNYSSVTLWPGVLESADEWLEFDDFGLPILYIDLEHRMIHPDEFELKVIYKELPGTVDRDGFEIQVLRGRAKMARPKLEREDS